MKGLHVRRTTTAAGRLAVGLCGLVGLVFAPTAAEAALAPTDPSLVHGLALYSSMNDVTPYLHAGYWEDASGNGYDTIQNGVAYSGEEDPGGANRATAINFNAPNPREMTLFNGFDAALDPGTTDYSISLWYNQTVATGFQYLFDKGNDASSNNAGFCLNSNGGKLGIRMNDAGGLAETKVSIATTEALSAGWHHLVSVFDRSGVYSVPDTLSLFIDGALFGSTTLPSVGTNPYNVSVPTKEAYLAGRPAADFTYNLQGQLDDVAIYRGVLSATDVSTLYNLPSTTPLDADTISNVTPVVIQNFEANLNRAADVVGTVGDFTAEYPGEIRTPSVAQATDPERGLVMDFDGGAKIGSYGRGVHYGDVLDPGTGSYTVSVWFKTDDVTTMQRIANKGQHGSTADGWIISVSNGELWVRGYDDTMENRLGLIKSGVTAGQWHHVALVLDQDLGIIRGYLNGQGSGDTGTSNGWSILDGYSLSFTKGTDFQGDGNTSIGAEQATNASYPLMGQLDDFAIWNRKLSDTEIYALAVPEPTILTLVVSGLALAAWRKRKRQS